MYFQIIIIKGKNIICFQKINNIIFKYLFSNIHFQKRLFSNIMFLYSVSKYSKILYIKYSFSKNIFFSNTRFSNTRFQILVFRYLKYMFSKTRLFSNTHFEIHIFKTTIILDFKTGVWKQHEISNFYKNIFTIFKYSILKRVSHLFSSNMRFQIHVFFQILVFKNVFPSNTRFSNTRFQKFEIYVFKNSIIFKHSFWNTHFQKRL